MVWGEKTGIILGLHWWFEEKKTRNMNTSRPKVHIYIFFNCLKLVIVMLSLKI